MAKRVNRTRRLYSKMDKRKRKTKRKMRKKCRTKKLNKRGGACLGCGSSLKEYYLYKGDHLIHEDPIALTPDKVKIWINSGYRVEEEPKRRRRK